MLPGKTYSAKDFVAVAWRRLWLAPLPLVTLFVALLYSSRLPDVYQSEMLIAIVPQRVPDEFVRSTVTLRTEERLDAITVQTKSRTVLEPMIDEFQLYTRERARLPMEDVVQAMRDNIRVQLETPREGPRGPETTAFRVQFTYPDASTVARVTQRLGSIFVDQNVRDRGALAKSTDEFLQGQLNEARTRLEVQEKRVEGFRERHGNSLPTQLQSNLQASQSAQLQIQALVEAIARDRDRKLMLERLFREAQNEPAPVIAAVTMPTTAGAPAPPSSPQQQLAVARANLATLSGRLTPEHPDIARLKRQIAELEQKVAAEPTPTAAAAAETGSVSTSLEETARRERLRQMQAEIESLDRLTQFKESEERRLRALVAEYQRRIEAVPGVESEWSVLTRDYDTMQSSYKELLSKSEASKVAVDLENRQIGENFRVLDPARVPVNPVSPKRIQISGIGIVIGLLLAIGVAALLELRDASFRSESEVLTVLALPVLAVVPYVETSSERKKRLVRWAAAGAVGVVVAASAGYVFWTLRLWTVVI